MKSPHPPSQEPPQGPAHFQATPTPTQPELCGLNFHNCPICGARLPPLGQACTGRGLLGEAAFGRGVWPPITWAAEEATSSWASMQAMKEGRVFSSVADFVKNCFEKSIFGFVFT